MTKIVKKNKEQNLELIKESGVVYTPLWIAEFMASEIFQDLKINGDEKILDAGCGEGIFACEIVKKFSALCKKPIDKIIEENLYFIDIDKNSLEKTKENLQKLTKNKILNFNSINDDFCFYIFTQKFDFIIGNPPYVRIQNLNDKRKELQLQFISARSGSIDLYYCFFEKSLRLLTQNGKISFITPNSHFHSLAGQNLRKLLQIHLSKIINFDHFQVFENVTTYSAISFLEKKEQKEFLYTQNYKNNFTNLDYCKIKNKSLNNSKWEFFNNALSKEIEKNKKEFLTLDDIANIHYGIATLKDDLYIFKPSKIDKDFFYINDEKIEKSICKPIIKASTYKGQDQNLYVIFPYKNEKLINKTELQKNYPFLYQYFLKNKEELLKRDKGQAINYEEFYAFGRNQGLKTSFGKKIITSSMNLSPKFYVIEDENTSFYAGYCIKPKIDMDLKKLCQILNSKQMEDYINLTSKSYRGGYKSYSKTFIKNFISNEFPAKNKTLFDMV